MTNINFFLPPALTSLVKLTSNRHFDGLKTHPMCQERKGSMKLKKRMIAAVLLVFILAPLGSAQGIPPSEDALGEYDHPPDLFTSFFTDVPADHWARGAIEFVYEYGIMEGMPGNLFAPSETVSRGQVATILYRLAGEPAVVFHPAFSDVQAGQWYANAIVWASDNDIVRGLDDGRFAPNEHVTREQFAAMFHRYARFAGHDTSVPANFSLASFADHRQISTWAVDYMRWANRSGLIRGTPERTLNPQGSTSRAECATVLQRFIQAPGEGGVPDRPTLCSIDAALAAGVVQPAHVSWYKRLFNQHNRVDSSFSPPNRRTLTGSHVSVDARIYEPLNRMMSSARAAGATIWAQSGYRNYNTQRQLFENRVNRYIGRGYSRAQAEQNTARWIARPGTSEHQSGLAIDFNCITMAFERTAAFRWLVDNAHRYGFILRYPPGTTHITGVNYEPWHFRYVGVEHASKIWEYGVTLEEYIKWYFWSGR